MPNEPDEPTVITQPFYTLAPENFRRIIQRQIRSAVAKQINGIYGFRMGDAMKDARFGNSRPSVTIAMENRHGRPYFVVGASPVNDVNIAHP